MIALRSLIWYNLEIKNIVQRRKNLIAKIADKKLRFVITPIGDNNSDIRRHIGNYRPGHQLSMKTYNINIKMQNKQEKNSKSTYEREFCVKFKQDKAFETLSVAWDHSTWDYNRDMLGEIFVVFKKDNKIVVSFGTNEIAKVIILKNTSRGER